MRDVTRVSCSHCGKMVRPANYAEHRWACPLVCHHCDKRFPAEKYVAHVRECLASVIADWDEMEYARKYFQQVRAISRFPHPGAPRRRSKFRAWGWWLKPGGAVLAPGAVGMDEAAVEREML